MRMSLATRQARTYHLLAMITGMQCWYVHCELGVLDLHAAVPIQAVMLSSGEGNSCDTIARYCLWFCCSQPLGQEPSLHLRDIYLLLSDSALTYSTGIRKLVPATEAGGCEDTQSLVDSHAQPCDRAQPAHRAAAGMHPSRPCPLYLRVAVWHCRYCLYGWQACKVVQHCKVCAYCNYHVTHLMALQISIALPNLLQG